jgi:hypothetical protein
VAIHPVTCISRRGIGKPRPRLVHCSDLKRAALILDKSGGSRSSRLTVSDTMARILGFPGPQPPSIGKPSPNQSPSGSCLQMSRLARLGAAFAGHACSSGLPVAGNAHEGKSRPDNSGRGSSQNSQSEMKLGVILALTRLGLQLLSTRFSRGEEVPKRVREELKDSRAVA